VQRLAKAEKTIAFYRIYAINVLKAKLKWRFTI
jgi:hypothetical protein